MRAKNCQADVSCALILGGQINVADIIWVPRFFCEWIKRKKYVIIIKID